MSVEDRFFPDYSEPVDMKLPKKKFSPSDEELSSTNMRRRRYSLATFGKTEGASDSYDSAVQTDPIAEEEPVAETSSSHKKNGKKKQKKHKNSFSKGFFEFMSFADSSNNPNPSPKGLQSKSVPIITPDPTAGQTRRSSYDIMEVDEADDGLHMPIIPKLPKGKKLLDTTVPEDVDSLFKSVFENETFFEIVGSKAYDEFRHYECSKWCQSRSSGLLERTMRYEMTKHIAFSRQNVTVEQSQIKLAYSRRGVVYGVDTVTVNSGVVYSDYFQLNIHYRFTQDDDRPLTHARLQVVADIEFVKPCLFKGRIEAEAWSGMKKYYEVVDKEVQLEKQDVDYPDVVDNILGSNSKLLKDNWNRRIVQDSVIRHHPLGLESTFPSPASQEVTLVAVFLIIMILLMITLAMFRLSATICLLDERLSRIEELLERNGKIFDLILNTKSEDMPL